MEKACSSITSFLPCLPIEWPSYHTAYCHFLFAPLYNYNEGENFYPVGDLFEYFTNERKFGDHHRRWFFFLLLPWDFVHFFLFLLEAYRTSFLLLPLFLQTSKAITKASLGATWYAQMVFFGKGPLNHLSSCALQFGYHVVGCTDGLCSSCLCTWLSSSTRTRC